MKKVINYLRKPIKLAILNLMLIATAVIYNHINQVFCIPVFWSLIVLVTIGFSTVFYLLFQQNKPISIAFSFLNGIGFCVYIYCILFLEFMNIWGIPLILVGIGLITFIPHFLAIQLFVKHIIRPKFKEMRIAFVLGVLVSISSIFYINYEYNIALKSIEEFKKSEYSTLNKSYFTERIVGMHFIYHTRFCEFDGWRPPKHDPALIIGMWLNFRDDPLDFMDLTKRLELYKKFFPNRKYKFDCSCGLLESSTYHEDELWK